MRKGVDDRDDLARGTARHAHLPEGRYVCLYVICYSEGNAGLSYVDAQDPAVRDEEAMERLESHQLKLLHVRFLK